MNKDNATIENILRQAASKADEREMSWLEEEMSFESPHEFTSQFERKMKRMFQYGGGARLGFVDTRNKRLAIIAAAMLLVLMIPSFTIKAVREPVVRFIVDVCEKVSTSLFDRPGTKGNVPDTIDGPRKERVLPKDVGVKQGAETSMGDVPIVDVGVKVRDDKRNFKVDRSITAAILNPSALPKEDLDADAAQSDGQSETIPVIPTSQITQPSAWPGAKPKASPTATPEASPTVTPEASPTATLEASPTVTPEASPTVTPEPSPTATPEASPTATPEVPRIPKIMGTEGKNEDDVRIVEQIFNEQWKRAYDVGKSIKISWNLDGGQYEWNQEGRLVCIYWHMCNLTGELDLRGLTALETLYCQSNGLTVLKVDGLESLSLLNCSYNSLTDLEVGSLASLCLLDCEMNQLTSLQVKECTNLVKLCCKDNPLTYLDLAGLECLETVICDEEVVFSWGAP